jgi:hypothetical protein
MLPVGEEMFNCDQPFDLVFFVAFCPGCHVVKTLLPFWRCTGKGRESFRDSNGWAGP